MANRKKIPTLEFNTYNALNSYVSSSKSVIFNDIIDSIEYAMKNKKEVAKPFAIKYNKAPDVIELGITPALWPSTVEHIYSYMMANEKYEYIPKIAKLKEKLDININQEVVRTIL